MDVVAILKPGSGAGALLGACLAILVLSSPAAAQSLRPNILVIFDTSGSMLENNMGQGQNDDGSPLCSAASGNGPSTRLYGLKSALRAALAQVGTDEANFGLMRFAQIERPTVAPICTRGHYFNDFTTAMPTTCTGSCGGSCRCGCRLTTHTTEATYGPWFDNGLRQALVVDVTQRPAGLKPVAADFDPADANIAEVYRWTDLSEDTDTDATITDPELRTSGSWYTPLGRSLFYARMYFDNYVKPVDPKGSCRTNVVILVTDGAETCDETAGSMLDLATCAQTGYTEFHPRLQACRLYRTTNAKTYVLTDTSTGAANDTIAAAGGTGTAIRVSLADSDAVKAALLGIIAETVPPPEMCNGVDDNCNSIIDEGVSNMCPLDTVGLKHCALETCNCLDDDCDGQIDEGFPVNACGQPSCCPIPPEICNGLDDNCNGDLDEGFNVGQTCNNNGIGACRRGGLLACTMNGSGTFCDAPVVTPGIEVCNNIDDNCNGQVDEGTLPGVGDNCGVSLGTCMVGKTACVNGKLVCNTTSMPMNEVCNGADDNCDGVIDNGVFPEVGQECLCPGLLATQVGVGLCKKGRVFCRGAMGFVCEGCVLPAKEICDGLDNDCDGVSDVTAMCPSGFACREGQCTLTCKGGEFPCPGGYKCVADYCVPERCAGVTCPGDMRCDETTGTCVELCAGVVCAAPKVCQSGTCVDCNTFGCNPGQLCVDGRCQIDKCLTVTCGDDRYCQDGKCIDLCMPGKCASTERCVAGQCIADRCSTVGCPTGDFCDQATGQCRGNPCQVKQCEVGDRCVPATGLCEPDPCKTINCPASPCWACGTTSDGKGSCLLTDAPECKVLLKQVGIRGAGCSCATAGHDTPVTGLLALALAALWGLATLRRRRARR